jgi:hypothetical protein
MLSPTTPYIMHNITSNILSENLKRDYRINPSFNLSILSLTIEINRENERILESIDDPKNSIEVFCKNSPSNLARILGAIESVKTGFFEKILPSIKTEIVLVTCWNIYSVPFIKFLLSNGKRVVMGGSFCNSYETDFIRSLVGENENLIIVKGFVDIETDIYKIITDWKDVDIKLNNFSSMWVATEDHMKKYINLIHKCRNIQSAYYSITFNNNCWYNKCKFCKLRDKTLPDFIQDADEDLLYENILRNLQEYKTKNLLINDNYFIFNKKNKKIFSKLRKDGISIYILSGIKSFNSKEYLKNFNEYVDEVGIGLESTTDFSLDYIIKGYGWEDIKESISNMSKYLDRDKKIRYLYIIDLVSRDKKDILERYQNMVTMKETLNGHGFNKIEFSPTPLQIFPEVGMIKNDKYINIKDNYSNSSSGMWHIYNYFKNNFDVEINVPLNLMMPFERFDINGNLLYSDFEYIDVDIMNKLKSHS